MKPSITLSGLAKYMIAAASPSQQMKILEEFKYPDMGEIQAKYYRDAYRIIHEYHEQGNDASWLLDEAGYLHAKAQQSPLDRVRTRIEHNVRAIRVYEHYFAIHNVKDKERAPSLMYSHTGLRVRVTPDLFGKERAHPRLVMLQFAQSSNHEKRAKIICQIMLEASTAGGLSLPSSAMRVWDCQTNEDYHFARAGSRLRRDIEAACRAVVALWPTI